MATDSLPGRGLPTDDPVSAPCSITPSAPPLESVQPVTVADTDPTGSAKRGLIEVPGYDILEEIGRGGMGVVYKAHQRRLNRIVALKMVLSGEHASAAELVRFLAEGEAVAQLHHPGIVQIHEIGQHNNLPYFCLEYVAGGSLNHLLRGRPQVPRQAATLVQSLACAVQHAHEHGIIHRDLKPANILLTADGSPRITDFGLAKRIAAGCGMTQTGAILGTPSYMAPEQAAGQGKEAGPATDVYALGAILYECLTGRPPFLAATPVDTMMQVVHQEPVPPVQLQPGLPRDLNTICLKCLRKEPARRYTTAAELADDLGRFLADRPILARPIGIAERGWRWCRRNPVVAAMTGSLALLLVVIAAGASLAAWRLDEQERRTARANEDRALQSEELAKRSEERAVGEERQKTERLWESLLDRARAGRFSHQAGQRFGGLQALARAARMRSDPALRDEAIALLALVDLRLASAGEGRTAGHPGAIEGGPTQLAAEGDAQGGLRIWRRWDGRELARLPGRRGPAVWHVTRFSPDGRFLAVWHSANTADAVRVVIWDWQARKVVLESNETVSGGALNWDPASRLLAVGRADGTIFLFDAKQGKVAGQLACGSVPDQLVFDSAGKRLAVSSAHQDDVRIFDLVSGQRLFRQEHPAGVRGVVFSPDGLLLATGCDDGNGYVWDLEKGRQQAILRGHQKSVIRLAFHPNGRLLASDGWDGHLWLWDPFDGRSLASTTGTLAGPFSADGRWLPARAGLYQVVGGEEWSSLYAAGGNRLSEVSFHRDGRLLAVSSVEGVRLWDVQQGRPAGFVPVGWCAALFDPAGDLITDGGRGLLRHPVRREAGTLVIDPPRSLAVPVRSQNVLMLAASGKGHLAVVDYGSWRGLLFPPGDKGPPIALAHPSTTCIDISHDGKHVATGSSYDETLKLWSETGQLLHTLKGGHMAPRFSPDGLHLAVCGDQELRLYQVSTWKQQWQRPRAQDAHLDVNGSVTAPAFSPNGRLLAYPHSPHQVRLVRGDGELVATLESPDPRLIGALSFSPDGRLLAVGTDKGAQLWDLSALHRELKAIALDADLPAWRPTGRGDGKLVVRVQRTETPAVAEARKRRTATNEQIGGWVLQVQASDDGRARQALAEVGGPALPILARAARSSDIGRAALERLFAQISTDERLEPTRVSLRLRDASVEKAVAALAAQVKTVLTLEAGVATELSLPPVTLEVENVSFWEALDRLCRTAGLAWTRAPGRGLILKRGAAVPAVSVAYAGASRLRISRLDLWSAHGLEGAGKGTSGLNLALQLHAEPHTRSVWLRRARIVEAREAAGSTLQDKGEANSPLFGPFPLGSSPVNLGVTLSAPRRSGGTLARLRVVVPFLVETQVRRLGTVSLAGAGSMSCIPLAHGGRLEILRVREVGQVVEIDVVQSEPAAAATDSYQRFEVLDDQGRLYRPLNAALTGAGQSPPRGQELLWLATPGVPWSALALHMRGQLGVQLRGTLRFERSAGLGRLHRLVLSRRIAQTRELTFEFRDVPLP